MVTITLKKRIQGRKYPNPFSFLSTKDRYLEKVYTLEFFNAMALHESENVEKAYNKAVQGEEPTRAEIDACLDWFCLIFEHQFTKEELLKGYPVDRLRMDIFAAYYAMQQGIMEALTEFPIPPTAMMEKTEV